MHQHPRREYFLPVRYLYRKEIGEDRSIQSMYIRCTVESVAIVFDELVDYGKVTDHVSIFFRYTEYSYKDLQKKDRIKIPLPGQLPDQPVRGAGYEPST